MVLLVALLTPMIALDWQLSSKWGVMVRSVLQQRHHEISRHHLPSIVGGRRTPNNSGVISRQRCLLLFGIYGIFIFAMLAAAHYPSS